MCKSQHSEPIGIESDRDIFGQLELSRFVALDLETTGLDPTVHGIIEIGAVRFENGIETDHFHSLLRSDSPLDPFITELTGITDDDLQTAPGFSDIAADLQHFLGNDILVGHNLEFDLGFLRTAGHALAGAANANPFLFAKSRTVDTGMVTRVFWPELHSFSLGTLTKAFQVPLPRAHRGLDDARATGMLLSSLLTALPDRIWPELAADLNHLIGSTSHRGRFLFQSLIHVAAGHSKPVAAESVAGENPSVTANGPLADVLDADGPFASALSFYSPREPQIAMAAAVEESFAQGEFLLVEAPTGVGKSLAYLVPAFRWLADARDEKRQVIVSSHTKILQEQLFRKDVRDIRRATGSDVDAAVIKGRNNYLCKRRLRALLQEAPERLSEQDRIHLMPLLRWAETTTTGDIGEISGFSVRHQPFLWSLVASDALTCAGSACGSAKGDFHRAATERAARAALVFVNHALLATDMSRFLGGGRRLVIDEAHQFERAVIGAMTVEVSAMILRNALIRIADERPPRGFLPGLLDRFTDQIGERLFTDGTELTATARGLYALVRQTLSTLAEFLSRRLSESERSARLRFQPGSALYAEIAEAIAPLRLAWSEFYTGLRQFETDLGAVRGDNRLPAEMLFEVRSAVERVERSHAAMESVLGIENENSVSWIEFGKTAHSGWCSLHTAPVSAGRLMSQLWPLAEGAVFTSATLTVNGTFDAVRDPLGLSASNVREAVLPSPFDLANQMRIFVPAYLPDPRQSAEAHAVAVAKLIADLGARFERGTLILCTSNDMVDRIGAALAPVARKTGRLILSQRAGGAPAELVAAFRRARNAVLVGAMGFWEGIDVIGEALQILIVTRLPFDVPTDPWVAARGEFVADSGRDPFMDFSLPVAALRLKQGVGRLIRHPADRGVAVLADPRLFTTRYGRTIRDSLPVAARRTDNAAELEDAMSDFFNEVSA